jgi:hypothetical protein
MLKPSMAITSVGFLSSRRESTVQIGIPNAKASTIASWTLSICFGSSSQKKVNR